MPSSDPASLVNRLQGISGALGRKAPVRVASTGNVALTGLQIIDGYQLIEGHRVLLKDQTTASENGIWNASSGNWTRSQDFNKRDDVVNGTDVVTAYGSQAGRNYVVSFVEPLTFGTTALTFTSRDAAALADGSVVTAKLGDVAVTTPKIAAQAVTYDKLPDAPAQTFLGRQGSVSGSMAPMTVAQVKGVLGRWVNSELADMAPLTIKGNSSTDTTGAAQDLTVAAVKTMLGLSGYLPLTGGTLSGALQINANLTLNGGDLTAYRAGGASGFLNFNSTATRYVGFDGSNYTMPGADLIVNGGVLAKISFVNDFISGMRQVDAGATVIAFGATAAVPNGSFVRGMTNNSSITLFSYYIQHSRPNFGWVTIS